MISINKIEYYLVFIFALANYFLPTEVTFSLALLGVIFSVWGRGIQKEHLQVLTIPLILLGLGLINAYKNDFTLVVKDVYYYFNPIVVFSFGYVCAYYLSVDKFFKVWIVLGVILALAYLLNHNWGSNYTSVRDMRLEEGVASYVVIIALVMHLIKIIRKEYLFPKPIRYTFLTILALSSIIAVSRTFLLVFIILIVFGTGQLKFKKYFILKFVLISIIGLVVTFALVNFQVEDRSSFMGKLLNSVDEVAISDYNDLGEINNNWRGFEAFMGWEQINRGNFLEWIVGQGFGKSTPIGLEIQLGEEYFTEIPYFHNGYITLILKTGIIGLLIYIGFFVRLSIKNLKEEFIYSDDYEICKNIITGLAITLLLTTFIISGWLNKSTLAPVIFSLGYFVNAKGNIKGFYEEENLEHN